VDADSAGDGVARFALVELHGRLPPQSWQLKVCEISHIRSNQLRII
jgi:hypothetical protein